MSARVNSQNRLSERRTSPEWGQVAALKGIGWALLDVADAIRESRAPHPTTTERPTAEAVGESESSDE